MYEFLCEHTFWVLLTQTYLGVELLVQLLSHVRLFASPWTAAPQASLSIINTRSLLRLMSIESVMPSNHLLLYCPLLLLPSIFPTDPMDCSTPTFLSIINSQSLLKLICIKSVMPSIKLVMPSNHFILCHPFSSCLQSFPASGSFQMSQFFTSGSQSIGALASASVLPVNIQDDGLVWSPCSPKELSRELLGHVVILFNFSRNCQTLFLSGYNSL